MSLLPGIGLYNSSRLPDAAFIDAFVARHDELERLTKSLQEQVSGGAPEHHIIIGSRGMGKSTLLRRLSLAIRDSTALAGGLVPLGFREEQYNVLTLAQFWRNCGESLADWCEQNDRQSLAQDLDRAMAGPNWRDGIAAGEEFLAACQLLGRRAVLLIDNLDLILDALKDQEPWQLRNVLQRRDGPIVVGAATQFLSQASDREAAFYEFFHPLVLEPLSEADLFACLRALAELRGEAGAPVLRIIAQDSPRLRTLYSLTGGNPRVLALLYQVLERSESADVFGDLESLLDQVSPYYKARVEEYATAQQRAVIDAMALHWDPITSHDLSQETGIPVTTLSGHLLRLKRDGFAEEVTLSGARAGYQLAERFFNIWYLMRHGTRSTRHRLRWLTILLTRLFSRDDLARIIMAAGRGINHNLENQDYFDAALAAYEDVILREGSGPTLANKIYSIKPIDISNDISRSVQDAKERIERGNRDYYSRELNNSLKYYSEIIDQYGNTSHPELEEYVARSLVNKGATLGLLGQFTDALKIIDSVIKRYGDVDNPILEGQVTQARYNKGVILGKMGLLKEAVDCYQAVINRHQGSNAPELQELVTSAFYNKGIALGEIGDMQGAIDAYQSIIGLYGNTPNPKLQLQVAWAWYNKGATLNHFGFLQESIQVYQELLDHYKDNFTENLREPLATTLYNKGITLKHLGKLDESIRSHSSLVNNYRKFPEHYLQQQVAKALTNMASILGEQGRFEDALEANRSVIKYYSNVENTQLKEQVAMALINMAIDLGHLGKTEEALNTIQTLNDRYGNSNARELKSLVKKGSDVISFLKSLPLRSIDLIKSGLAIGEDNFGAMTFHLGAALNRNTKSHTIAFSDDLLRLLRLVEAKGYGEKLIAWFSESGMADRYAPVHAAFIAYCRGERFLLDVNPEVRAPARTLYDRLSAPRRRQEAPPPAPKKRGRPRKG